MTNGEEEFQIPQAWLEKPPGIDEIPECCFIVQTDAGFKNGITGVSVIIRTNGHEYNPVEYTARSKGPHHAEMTAIKKALIRLNGIKKQKNLVLIYSDSKYACRLILGHWQPQRSYIKNCKSEVENLCTNTDCDVYLINIRNKYNKRVDRRALKARESEEQRKLEQIEKRIEKVESAIMRSRVILINETQGRYYASPKIGGFLPGNLVSLNPPSCNCPWWQNNWGNKSEVIKNARSLPCKHMCALAEHLGLDIYEIFDHQITRND